MKHIIRLYTGFGVIIVGCTLGWGALWVLKQIFGRVRPEHITFAILVITVAYFIGVFVTGLIKTNKSKMNDVAAIIVIQDKDGVRLMRDDETIAVFYGPDAEGLAWLATDHINEYFGKGWGKP